MEILVTCAIIEQDGKVLCAQRSEAMSLPLKWEFPGGKAEIGETPGEGLLREIKEELSVDLELLEQLPDNTHEYSPEKIIRLIPYRCRILNGNIDLSEHAQIVWLTSDELEKLDWAEADIPIVKYYRKNYL